MWGCFFSFLYIINICCTLLATSALLAQLVEQLPLKEKGQRLDPGWADYVAKRNNPPKKTRGRFRAGIEALLQNFLELSANKKSERGTGRVATASPTGRTRINKFKENIGNYSKERARNKEWLATICGKGRCGS